jgi:hypothetical protein
MTDVNEIVWRKLKPQEIPSELIERAAELHVDVPEIFVNEDNFYAARDSRGSWLFVGTLENLTGRMLPAVIRELSQELPAIADAPAPWETITELVRQPDFAERSDYAEVFEGLKRLEARSARLPEPPVLVYDRETFKDSSALVVDVERRHETRPGVYRIQAGRGYLSVDVTKSEAAGGPVILGALIDKTLMHLYGRSWACSSLWTHEAAWGIVSDRRLAERLGTKPDQVRRALFTLAGARFVLNIGSKVRTIQTPIPTAHFFDSPQGEPPERIVCYRWNPDFLRQIGNDWHHRTFDRTRPAEPYVSVPLSWSRASLTTQEARAKNWLRLELPGKKTMPLRRFLCDTCGFSEQSVKTTKERMAAVESVISKLDELHLLARLPGGKLYKVTDETTFDETQITFIKRRAPGEKPDAEPKPKTTKLDGNDESQGESPTLRTEPAPELRVDDSPPTDPKREHEAWETARALWRDVIKKIPAAKSPAEQAESAERQRRLLEKLRTVDDTSEPPK